MNLATIIAHVMMATMPPYHANITPPAAQMQELCLWVGFEPTGNDDVKFCLLGDRASPVGVFLGPVGGNRQVRNSDGVARTYKLVINEGSLLRHEGAFHQYAVLWVHDEVSGRLAAMTFTVNARLADGWHRTKAGVWPIRAEVEWGQVEMFVSDQKALPLESMPIDSPLVDPMK